ncbi:uncharacterized protein KQ657_002384 [Scheffersomyces spartinae]|uniref:Uncharacterized protein n=1 Tax=Scheffersomyces spartinae TaxID=45513 RepID=A0A9P7V6C4_9ASCO|nr:uncharacterized protein KQ657_002384 [Scheffersomyces spartinae]KAG7192029.1 hypothetical protein KQ657_002384 [Scheffersomyces spartinae]
MVNLATVKGRRSFAHVQSDIPSLDHMVGLTTNGIVDVQSVPGTTNGSEAVIAVYIHKHLLHSPNSHVVVIDCLHPFAMNLVRQHSQFETDNWSDRIHWYHEIKFVQLEWLFGELLANPSARSDILVVVNSFHEACTLYRNLLVLRSKETLLQFQSSRNETLIRGLDRFKEEGAIPKVSLLPAGSELLKVSPASKFDSHLIHLLSNMSLVAYSKNLLVILHGTMDVGWRSFEPVETITQTMVSTQPRPSSTQSRVSTQPTPSSTQPVSSSSQQVFAGTPSARLTFVSSFLKTPAVNAYISKRLLFYKDWYHRTVHFTKRFQVDSSSHLQLDPQQLHSVYGVAVFNQNVSGSKHIGYVNFDFDSPFYRKFGSKSSVSESNWSFIDLNDYQCPMANPIWSDSDNDDHDDGTTTTAMRIPPSSPTLETTVERGDDSQLIGDSEEEELL